MPIEGQAIRETVVYAQDTQPTDERDGVLWVDTTENPRITYVYSTDSSSWENVAPSQSFIPKAPTDVTASRSKNTEYQNTTGNALAVYVRGGRDGSTGVTGSTSLQFGEVSGSLQTAFHMSHRLSATDFDTTHQDGVFGIIPDGYYYEVAQGAPMGTGLWVEQELTVA